MKLLKVGQIEPFALLTLAGGLLYSIGILIIEAKPKTCYRFHFIVLTLVIFIALLCLCALKYLKYRFACRQMDDLIMAMKIK